MNTSSDKSPYLRIKNLVKKFGDFTALQDISLDVFEGEFICFLGPSGCGKTTLLRAIAGLDIQTHGTVEQNGQDVSNLPPSERDFGIVFQSYALFPNLTIEKNISYGLENIGRPKDEITARVTELLDLVGLPDQGKKYPAQLSGGQQQRIALARALAMSPGLLLLDEPLSALDAKVRGHLRHEIKDLQQRLGVTTIMVTHDQEEALTMADRIVVMNQGVIDQVGTPTEIYGVPETLFVADFIGAMNHIPAIAEADQKARIGGLTLSCGPNSVPVGSEGVLAMRPEDVVPGSSKDDPNSLQVTVEEMEFYGAFWRAQLGGGALGDVKIEADFSVNAIRRLDLAVDKEITVCFPSERLRFFRAA